MGLKCPKCKVKLLNLKYSLTGIDVLVKDLYFCHICSKIYKLNLKEIIW